MRRRFSHRLKFKIHRSKLPNLLLPTFGELPFILIRMNVRKMLIGAILLTLSGAVQAQQISKVNFNVITEAVKSPKSRYHYPKLFERYKRNDTTLSKVDYKYLYYGQPAVAGYQPYVKNPKKKELNAALQQNDHSKAIALGKEILATKPFDVNTVFGMVAGYSQMKNDAEAKLWDYKFRRLVDVILDSGDGLKKETAYVVTDAGDEFIVTGILGLDVVKQTVVDGKYDLLEIAYPNEFNIKQLYFNIEKPLSVIGKKTTAKK